MDESSATGRMLAALKRELKVKGLRYSDVATRLGVSEVTVKRYLSGKGLDVPALEKLAAAADLDLLTLVNMAEQQRASTPTMNKAQQVALGKSTSLAAVYFGLLRGWPPAQVGQEFGIPASKMEGHLVKLTNLGLIRQVGAGGFKLLVKPDADKKGGGLLEDLMIRSAQKFLSEINIRDEKCEWFYNAVHLSPASGAKLRKLVKTFTADMRDIIKSDGSLPTPNGQWYRVFICADPVNRKRIYDQGG